MMCDVLIAADTAKFGQPEIKLGVLPGMGGSQRLTRAVGKAKAMDMILTGRTIDAAEADRIGLVSRVVPADDLLAQANAVATTISQMSRSATRMAKEAVNRAFESSLTEGLLYERRLFHSAFATDDQVVVDLDGQGPGGLDDLSGHVDIGAAGRRVAGRMVVDQDHGGRGDFQSAAHDLARIDRSVIDRAPVLDLVEDQLVLLVEIQDPELFARLMLEREADIGQQSRP
jgi:hypothetical protein